MPCEYSQKKENSYCWKVYATSEQSPDFTINTRASLTIFIVALLLTVKRASWLRMLEFYHKQSGSQQSIDGGGFPSWQLVQFCEGPVQGSPKSFEIHPSRWWLNQPNWKICSRQIGSSFPKIRGENKKNLWETPPSRSMFSLHISSLFGIQEFPGIEVTASSFIEDTMTSGAVRSLLVWSISTPPEEVVLRRGGGLQAIYN